MLTHAAGFVVFLGDVARGALGVAAAMLPARWWTRLDRYVPASSSAAAAGLVTLLAAPAIGIPGFISYARWTADAHNDAAIAAAISHVEADNANTLRKLPMAFNALALPMFLLLTPAGWLTAYLGVSGLVRAAAGTLGPGCGDPLLTAADAAAVRVWRAARHAATRRRRESLEGPALPDRVVTGAQAGMPDAAFVIVASRPKPDWDAGTVILSGSAAYRVGAVEERTVGGRLRTLYPLIEHKDFEVFRRIVYYDLPGAPRA